LSGSIADYTLEQPAVSSGMISVKTMSPACGKDPSESAFSHAANPSIEKVMRPNLINVFRIIDSG